MAAKGKATLEGLQVLQRNKKELVVAKAILPRSDKEGRAKLQAKIDELIAARNAMAGELKATLKVTSSWAMGGRTELDAKGNAIVEREAIGICALYR